MPGRRQGVAREMPGTSKTDTEKAEKQDIQNEIKVKSSMAKHR